MKDRLVGYFQASLPQRVRNASGGPVTVDSFLARKPWSDRSTPRAAGPRVTTVRWPKHVREELMGNAYAESGSQECGGFLFGRLDGPHAVLIIDVSKTGNAERSRYAIRLDLEEAFRFQRLGKVCGSWHSHPGSSQQSETDRNGSLRMSERNAEGIDVGIIVTAHPNFGWAVPVPSAQIAQHGKITPATIEEVEEKWQ